MICSMDPCRALDACHAEGLTFSISSAVRSEDADGQQHMFTFDLQVWLQSCT